MVSVNTILKTWIFITLCFLFFWIIRIFPDSLERFYNIVFVSWNYYDRIVVGGWMYTIAAVGNTARLIGVVIGITSLIAIWTKKRNLYGVRRWVGTALPLESLYYASLIPGSIWLFALAGESGISYTLGISYLLQIIFTVPFLAMLGFKIFKRAEDLSDLKLAKWIGVAFSGYVIALWANSVLRWFDMVSTVGFEIFFAGIALVGVLNAFIFMSLALIFALAWAFSFANRKESAQIWLGLSLTMIGLHYAIYVIVSYLLGALASVWLVDIWTIPLLGLGLTIILRRAFAKKSN